MQNTDVDEIRSDERIKITEIIFDEKNHTDSKNTKMTKYDLPSNQ